MVFSLARFKKTGLDLPGFTQRFLLALVGFHLLNVFFNQAMISLQEMRMAEKSDNFIPQMFAVAFIGFVVQSLTKVLLILLTCYHFHHRTPLFSFLKKHTELGLIESLRAFFKALLWGFVFIIPGIVKMIRYQFVLFVVASSQKYERGELDALEGSDQLTRGHFMALTFLLFIFAAVSFSLNPTTSFFNHPVQVFLTEFFSFFFAIFQSIYMLHLFQDLLKERSWV